MRRRSRRPDPSDPRGWERAETHNQLRAIKVVAIVDVVLLVGLLALLPFEAERASSVLGALHGGVVLVLVLAVALGASMRLWGWWFVFVVIVGLGAIGAWIGEEIVGRRLRRGARGVVSEGAR